MRILFRLVIILVAIYAGLTAIRAVFGSTMPLRRRKPASAGHLVKDPVCGMYIPQETALRTGDSFFCSEECRGKFIAQQ